VSVGTTRTRAESLAADIETQIEGEHLSPGDLFGTLDELRERSGFARSTVSEAVRLLSDRGVLEIRPGRGGGLFVAVRTPVVRLRHMLLRVGDSSSPVSDAIVVREALEHPVDCDAARHRSSDDISDLRRMVSVLKRSKRSPETFMRTNWALHERIALITPNELLSATYLGTTRYIADSATRIDTDADDTYLEHRIAVHVELVEAIIAGDEDRTAAAVLAHNRAT
jgi:GntR family transcriptional repressor for pyruvate dehydrogenase complex